MAAKGATLPIDVKVSLVGLADSGKTSLINFLKGCNFDSDNQSNPDSSSSNETWGIAVNIIEWDYEPASEKAGTTVS